MLRAAASRGDETDVFSCDATRIDALDADRLRAVPRVGSHPHPRRSTISPTCTLPDGFSLAEEDTAARATIWFDDVNLVGLFEPVETDEALPATRPRAGGHDRGAAPHARRWACEAAIVSSTTSRTHPAAALYESLGFTVAYETVGFRSRLRGRSGTRSSRAG